VVAVDVGPALGVGAAVAGAVGVGVGVGFGVPLPMGDVLEPDTGGLDPIVAPPPHATSVSAATLKTIPREWGNFTRSTSSKNAVAKSVH
jgi:hypothetical protein